jgi:hypothetical protein
MKQTLLRSYIRKVILESVEAPQLAVVVDDSGTQKTAVIYDAQKLALAVKEKDLKDNASYVVGFVQISEPRGAKCRGAWAIRGIAGPGSLVYGAAYALSPTGLVVPDRSSVSPSAKRAWQGYFNKAMNSGNALPLDDADHPAPGTDEFHDEYHTPEAEDDCYTSHEEPYLNYAYMGMGGEGPRLEAMNDLHLTMMEDLAGSYPDMISQEELEAVILDAGYTFFDASTGY